MINLRKFPRVEPKRETRMGNNWKSQTLLVGMKKGTFTLRKTAWQLLTKLTIHLIHDPTVPLLGIHTSTQKLVHNMQNSIICNIPKLETTQIFISWWMVKTNYGIVIRWNTAAAAAAAKSLQLCPTLCDPIDGSPPGSPVPGILPARTLEWVAISFSKEWKWKGKVKSLSHVCLLATPWNAGYQAPLSMGFSRQE